jgi:pyridoxine kinase
VAYGYVGNRAAVFPLQRMGFDVTAVNTVQFSNHTGYGAWRGEVFSREHIASVLQGIEERGGFADCGAVLSGYLGDADLGQTLLAQVARLNAARPDLMYCCDPVMGDVGRGFFVRPGIPEFFRDHALPRATIATPNQFELEYLTGINIASLGDALRACDALHARGPRFVLVTSLQHPATPHGRMEMLVSTANGQRFLASTELLAFDPPPNGAGDCTAALFCGHILKGASPADALARTAAGIHAVLEATKLAGTRELALIKAQDAFVSGLGVPLIAL